MHNNKQKKSFLWKRRDINNIMNFSIKNKKKGISIPYQLNDLTRLLFTASNIKAPTLITIFKTITLDDHKPFPDGSSPTHLIICPSVCHKVPIRHGPNEIYFQLFLIASPKRRLVLPT